MDKKIFLELSHKRERTTEREFLPYKVREREREREREQKYLLFIKEKRTFGLFWTQQIQGKD